MASATARRLGAPAGLAESAQHSPREERVKVESVKPPKPQADAGVLHKKMMQLLSSLWVTHAIGSFARLGLADAMAAGAERAEAIAAPRGLSADRVYRLLRALTTVGIVVESGGGRFTLTPLGRLLTSDAPHSMRTSAMLLTEYHADIWGRLDGALKGGVAFEALHGEPLFAWLAARPQEAARFQRMMLEVHGPETPAIVAAYDFSRFQHIVDVGGGHGALLAAILAAYPGRRGTLFDLQQGIDAARQGEAGELPGITFAAGDVFEFVPAGGDAYLLRHLLHDYDDEDCLRMLGNVRRAMAPHARVLVLEKTVPIDDTPGPGRWLDLHVMLLTGGRERTAPEYEALFAKAGLRLARVLPTAHPAVEIVEAVAADAGRP
jgi:ubiquinone/menaquinone biosynthesis C-methylase UbiE